MRPSDQAGSPGRTRSGHDRRHQFPGRRNRVHLRFDTAEHQDLLTAATRSGITVTGFCANAAIAAARGTTTRDGLLTGTGITRHELATLQRELFAARTALIRTGSNLNQAMTAFNTTGQPPPWLQHAMRRCAASLDRVDAVLAAIDGRLR